GSGLFDAASGPRKRAHVARLGLSARRERCAEGACRAAPGARRSRADQGAGRFGPDRQASGVGLHGADRRIARRRARRPGSQRRSTRRVYGGVGKSRSEFAEPGVRRDEAQRPRRRGEERIMKRALVLIALATGVSGCATIKGWFSDSKAENIEPPTVLVEF